jgi:hypothetical protein
MMSLWWLSFADWRGPLGATIVRAHSFPEAVRVAHLLGVNPGGQVCGAEVPADLATMFEGYTERALSREDLERLGVAPWGDG